MASSKDQAYQTKSGMCEALIVLESDENAVSDMSRTPHVRCRGLYSLLSRHFTAAALAFGSFARRIFGLSGACLRMDSSSGVIFSFGPFCRKFVTMSQLIGFSSSSLKSSYVSHHQTGLASLLSSKDLPWPNEVINSGASSPTAKGKLNSNERWMVSQLIVTEIKPKQDSLYLYEVLNCFPRDPLGAFLIN